MNTTAENKCNVCGRKEGRDREFGYPIGYIETPLKVGGRQIIYQTCTKCKRCFVKENPHESNGFGAIRGKKRVVRIQKSIEQSSSPSEELRKLVQKQGDGPDTEGTTP